MFKEIIFKITQILELKFTLHCSSKTACGKWIAKCFPLIDHVQHQINKSVRSSDETPGEKLDRR